MVNITKTLVSKYNIIYFAIIVISLILGICLRLKGMPGEMGFWGDQGQDLVIALRIVQGEFYPLIGPILNVKNFFTPPTYYYFLASLLLLFRSEVGIFYFYVLINILSAIMFAIYIKNRVDSITAMLFFVFSMITFYSVYQSHAIWQPFPVAFFVSLAFLLISHTDKNFNYWKVILATLFFDIGLTIYFSTVVLVPIFLINLYKTIKRVTTKRAAIINTFIIFSGVTLLFYIPWAINEANNSFPTLNSIFSPVSYEAGESSHFIFFDNPKNVAVRLVENTNMLYKLINPQVWHSQIQPTLNIIFLSLLGILTLTIILKSGLFIKFKQFLLVNGYGYLFLGLLTLLFFDTQAWFHRLLVVLPFLLMFVAYMIRITIVGSNILIQILGGTFAILIIASGLTQLFPFDSRRDVQTYTNVTNLYSYLKNDIKFRNSKIIDHDFRVYTSNQPNYYETQGLWYLLKKNDNYPISFTIYGNDIEKPSASSELHKYSYLICFPDIPTFDNEECKKLFMPFYQDAKIINKSTLFPYTIFLVDNNLDTI